MANEQLANTAQSTLSAGINNSVTTLTVASAASFPTSGNFRIVVDSEILLVTAVSGTTFTVTRGVESTSAASHASGALVTHVLTAGGLTAWVATQPANDFGDGSDGALSLSDGATHTLATSTGVNDTGYVLKQYTSVSITAANTIVTAANRAQVMVIKVSGNCTIGDGSGGKLHMDAKGAAATPSGATSLARHLGNLWGEKVPQVFTIPQSGAGGGAGGTTGTVGVGTTGSNGASGQTGGGGGGAGGAGGGSSIGNGGAGASGSAFCGGSGGGAGGFSAGAGTSGGTAAGNGGQAGNAGSCSGAANDAGGGAGNPVGTGSAGTAGSVSDPTGGGGGTLILIVGGNLTIGSAGVISANGGAGGAAVGGQRAMGGGGAGGGAIIILYAGSLSNLGTVQANGGGGGFASGGSITNSIGGAGGSGSVQGPTQISNP